MMSAEPSSVGKCRLCRFPVRCAEARTCLKDPELHEPDGRRLDEIHRDFVRRAAE